MKKLKLEGNIELFDIAFGVLIGYATSKGTGNWAASIVIGIIMVLAMSSLKLSLKNKKNK